MNFLSRVTPLLLSISLAVLATRAVSMARFTEEKKPMINRSTPILHVKNVEPSVKFWTERFGFKVTIQVPEDDHIAFAAMEAGNIELMLQTYQGMKGDPNSPLAKAAEQGPSFIFMEVPDINAIIGVLKDAEIMQALHETPYGAKE